MKLAWTIKSRDFDCEMRTKSSAMSNEKKKSPKGETDDADDAAAAVDEDDDDDAFSRNVSRMFSLRSALAFDPHTRRGSRAPTTCRQRSLSPVLFLKIFIFFFKFLIINFFFCNSLSRATGGEPPDRRWPTGSSSGDRHIDSPRVAIRIIIDPLGDPRWTTWSPSLGVNAGAYVVLGIDDGHCLSRSFHVKRLSTLGSSTPNIYIFFFNLTKADNVNPVEPSKNPINPAKPSKTQ